MANKNLAFMVVYVNATSHVTKELNEKNFKDVKRFENEVYKEFQSQGEISDDFWIDDVWTDTQGLDNLKVDWQKIITGRQGSRLDQKMVDSIFNEGEEFVVKASFLSDIGYGLEKMEDTYVYDAKRENKIEGNFKNFFPEEWLAEEADNLGWTKPKFIDANYAYFEEPFARMMSDSIANGELTADWVGDYFVYFYGN